MFNSLPNEVNIIEVGPRDGLQNEARILKTADKMKYIELLSESGLKDMEVTSFVRPDKIMQMKDSKELFAQVFKNKLTDKMNAICLVPNMVGLNNAIASHVKHIAVFTAASNTFNQRNINTNILGSMERIAPVISQAKNTGIKVRGYISTAFGCPYEGEVDYKIVSKLAKKLLDQGCYEISLGDTIGVANPRSVKKLINHLAQDFDLGDFSMHFHDTRGAALANTLTSLELGITSFDSSSAGLGGCPYAGGATGNMATEDLVYLMHSLGINTGVDMDKLIEASVFILSKLERKSWASKFLTSYVLSKTALNQGK